jgi:uncharacterized membrane protein YdjX (TVP38/TMEM64 family)
MVDRSDPKLRRTARLRLFGILVLLLLVPIVPFLLFADQLDANTQRWLTSLASRPSILAAVGFMLLLSDLLLPVPSSLVCSLLGQHLGWLSASVVAWFGLMTGNMIGLGASRLFGSRFTHRFVDAVSLAEYEAWGQRYGAWLIVLSRPVPIVSEAALLWLGLTARITPLWIMLIGWTALGVAGKLTSLEWLANVISVMIPVSLLLVWRLVYPKRPKEVAEPTVDRDRIK